MYNHALVFGKFLPPHNGHLYLIGKATELAKKVTVLVCSTSKEPIDGVLRAQWLKEIYKVSPYITIKHFHDDVPQYPNEHPNFWTIWTNILSENMHPDTDVVCTSEDYGFEVARRLQIKHVLIDKARTIVPVSGTAIRENPIENWEYIPDEAKPYFRKKFIFVGAESTGKTTISKQVSNILNGIWVREYGREYCDELIGLNEPLLEQDFANIANAQESLIKHNYGSDLDKKFMIIDTDCIVTEAYAEMYLGFCPDSVKKFNSQPTDAIYLLMDNDIEWEQDNTRVYLKQEQRNEHRKLLSDLLVKYNRKFYLVNGTGITRLKNAMDIIIQKTYGKSYLLT